MNIEEVQEFCYPGSQIMTVEKSKRQNRPLIKRKGYLFFSKNISRRVESRKIYLKCSAVYMGENFEQYT